MQPGVFPLVDAVAGPFVNLVIMDDCVESSTPPRTSTPPKIRHPAAVVVVLVLRTSNNNWPITQHRVLRHCTPTPYPVLTHIRACPGARHGTQIPRWEQARPPLGPLAPLHGLLTAKGSESSESQESPVCMSRLTEALTNHLVYLDSKRHLVVLHQRNLNIDADMRKFHTKSRLGCQQCKKRRIKCDETRPVCRRCTHARLECSFQFQVPQKPSSLSVPLAVQISVDDAKPPFEPLPLDPSPTDPLLPPSSRPPDERFTSLHLQLLRHFETDLYEHEKQMHHGLHKLLKLHIEQAWQTPYLLDQVLAYSAAHKSSILPQGDRQPYLYEAKRMQTRALAGYNREKPVASEGTALSMFLFTGLLGHHIIYEAAVGAQAGLDSALESLIHSIAIHHGLIAVVQSTWHIFPEAERQMIMRSCQRDCDPLPSGPTSTNVCDPLLKRLSRCGLDEATKHVYRGTVEALQSRFDAVSYHDTHSTWAAIQDWLAAITPDYASMLASKEPEALVVLAYFAVLLHYAGEHWFVGSLGPRLVRLISHQLGPRWSQWLEWPVAETSGAARMPR